VGRFHLPPGLVVHTGGPYRLELDDGRTGEVFVVSATYSGTEVNGCRFRGYGPPP
jgi:hypothetical protein